MNTYGYLLLVSLTIFSCGKSSTESKTKNIFSKVCQIHSQWKAKNPGRAIQFSVAGDSFSEWPGFLSSSTYHSDLSGEERNFVKQYQSSINRAQSSEATCSSVRLSVLAAKNENFTCYGSGTGKRLRGAGTGTSALEREINGWRPTLLRIMIGTNEIYAGVAASSFESTLRSVVSDLISNHKIIPILFTIPPARKSNKISQSNQFNTIIKKVGDEFDILVHDFAARLSNSHIGSDGVHLTQAGQILHVSSTIRSFHKTIGLLNKCPNS